MLFDGVAHLVVLLLCDDSFHIIIRMCDPAKGHIMLIFILVSTKINGFHMT